MGEQLLTIAECLERIPARDDGYRPSERWFRDEVRRLGCFVELGREMYLTEALWGRFLTERSGCLSSSESAAGSGMRGAPSRRGNLMAPLPTDALKEARELATGNAQPKPPLSSTGNISTPPIVDLNKARHSRRPR